MKIQITFLTAVVLLLSCSLSAQEKQVQDAAQTREENMQAYVLLLRSDMNASKRAILKESMQLDQNRVLLSGLSTISTTPSRPNSPTRSSPSFKTTPAIL